MRHGICCDYLPDVFVVDYKYYQVIFVPLTQLQRMDGILNLLSVCSRAQGFKA